MPRTPANIAQILIVAYETEQSPTWERCQELAKETGLEVKQVSRWFNDRRLRGPQKQVGFTEDQCDGLHQALSKYGSSPSREILEQLTRELGLTRQQVQRWLSKRRTRCDFVARSQRSTAANVELLDKHRTHSELASEKIRTRHVAHQSLPRKSKESNEKLELKMCHPSQNFHRATSFPKVLTGSSEASTVNPPIAPATIFPIEDFFERLSQSLVTQSESLGQSLSTSLSQSLSMTLGDFLHASSMKNQSAIDSMQMQTQKLLETFHNKDHEVLSSIKTQIDRVEKSLSTSHSNISHRQSQLETSNVKNQKRVDSVETRLDGISQMIGELRDQIRLMHLPSNSIASPKSSLMAIASLSQSFPVQKTDFHLRPNMY